MVKLELIRYEIIYAGISLDVWQYQTNFIWINSHCIFLCSSIFAGCLVSELILYFKQDMNGRFLTVNKAAPRGSRPERPPRMSEPTFRIYVGNLPWDVDNARLEQVFSEHGKVVDARVVYDRESGRSRGFGFVTMSTEAELNDAIANLDGQVLNITCSFF